MTFSPSTLHTFAQLLDGHVLPVNHPQFEEAAAQLALAKRELAAAIQAETASAGDDE